MNKIEAIRPIDSVLDITHFPPHAQSSREQQKRHHRERSMNETVRAHVPPELDLEQKRAPGCIDTWARTELDSASTVTPPDLTEMSVRETLVAQIKADIKAGKLEVNTNRIAQGMLSRMSEFFN